MPALAGCEINDDPLAPICQACRIRVAERHGGRAGVESETGRGATFWFTLPGA